MSDFTYNVKCVIQGGFVVGVWYGSSSSQESSDQILPQPKWEWGSVLFALLLFYVTYVLNALLDIKLGCEHGSFWDRLAG